MEWEPQVELLLEVGPCVLESTNGKLKIHLHLAEQIMHQEICSVVQQNRT